jgi:predicted metallo-beta-lactamase superfamily hydrolase
MATYVESGETRILIDPGATLGPTRYRLPPASEEWEALKRANDRISAHALRAQLIFISHYHEDHFRYDPELYAGRRVWAKHPTRMINPKQRQRAGELWKAIRPHCHLDAAEGRHWEFKDVLLRVSPPLAHGVEGTGLGYVVALTVADRSRGISFVHASDVQGPLSAVATAYLIRERPGLLYLSGPPCYIEREIGATLVDQGIENLLRIIGATGCRVILDHYALRDPRHQERLRRLWETGQVVTAAGYLGLADELLEANRHLLWAKRRKPEACVERSRLKPATGWDRVGRRTVRHYGKGAKRR